MFYQKPRYIFGMAYQQIYFLVSIGVIALLTGCSASTPVMTPTAVLDLPSPIPGLNHSVLAAHLNKIGVTCKPAHANDPYGYFTTCDGSSANGLAEIHVEVSSREKTDGIYEINAVVSQYAENPSDEIAIEILGHIATIPYTNAEPDQASAWVKQNLALENRPTTIFGGISYDLHCSNKNFRCLIITQGAESP